VISGVRGLNFTQFVHDVEKIISSSNPFIYTVDQKQDTRILFITLPNANQFSKFVYCRFIRKFATRLFLNTPPHLKGVATLLCKILMSENSDNLKLVL